jgi:hypothetical protein
LNPSYNDKKQLIKKEIKHPEKKMDWFVTYTYYANDLPKEQMEDMGTSTYTFTTVYEYWDK